jgi:hypothetical protein
MKLNNIGMEIYVRSMGKVFAVTHIGTTESANAWCEKHSDDGVIAEDQHGRVYVATRFSGEMPAQFFGVGVSRKTSNDKPSRSNHA